MNSTMKKLLALPMLGLAAVAAAAGPATAGLAAADRTAAQSWVIVASEFGAGSGRLVATGPIHGIGTETVTTHVANADGTFTDTDLFDLPGGQVELTDTYTLDITFNPTSCRYSFAVKGTYRISDATGAFAGATGSGAFTGRGLVITGRDASGTCLTLDEITKPIAYTEVVRGSGTTIL